MGRDKQAGEKGLKPQQFPKGIRPETLEQLEYDERMTEHALRRLEQNEARNRRETEK
jgi:hypothetical protein